MTSVAPSERAWVAMSMSRKHVAHGVEEHRYGTVGQALIQTLAQAFGERFTPELRTAWLSAYGAISGVMIAAAASGTLPRAGAEHRPGIRAGVSV